MKEYDQKIYNIINNAKEDVIFQAHQAYKDGYEDGKADTPFTDTEEAEEKAYNRGLADMLEAVKHMRMMTADDLEEVFGLRFIGDIFVNLSPSKIISKYHAFKAQIKELEDTEIKVGDEIVYRDGIKGIVVGISNVAEQISVLNNEYDVPQLLVKNGLVKTGRHFDAIAEVLAELRGDKNDE